MAGDQVIEKQVILLLEVSKVIIWIPSQEVTSTTMEEHIQQHRINYKN